MSSFFTRERLLRPKNLAGLLLLIFLTETVWLAARELRASDAPEAHEAARIAEGWKQWRGHGIAGAPFLDVVAGDSNDGPSFDSQHSPLLYLASSAPLLAWPRDFDRESAAYWRWLPRIPFLACGVFLGASLWYVARRLCGNVGGLIALTFYCFSPSLIQATATWHTEPEIVAAWGAFGTIFTAIAVAHTLYAPREVVLWNWRRIVLLGVSLAIAIGAQFSLVVLVPIALGFLLYVAPVRQGAATVIWLAGCTLAFLLLFAAYFFHPHTFAVGLRHAEFLPTTWRGFAVWSVYRQVAVQIGRACPALALALPFMLATYAAWPRTRYFGNTAPLLVAAIFLVLAISHPESAPGFLLSAIPFLLIFVAGVLADLIETQYRAAVTAGVAGMLLAYVAWCVNSLVNVPQG